MGGESFKNGQIVRHKLDGTLHIVSHVGYTGLVYTQDRRNDRSGNFELAKIPVEGPEHREKPPYARRANWGQPQVVNPVFCTNQDITVPIKELKDLQQRVQGLLEANNLLLEQKRNLQRQVECAVERLEHTGWISTHVDPGKAPSVYSYVKDSLEAVSRIKADYPK